MKGIQAVFAHAMMVVGMKRTKMTLSEIEHRATVLKEEVYNIRIDMRAKGERLKLIIEELDDLKKELVKHE